MAEAVRVVVYSSNTATRRSVIDMVGRFPGPATGPVHFTETATAAALLTHLDAGDCDLAVLDGEATPAGGLGIARQLRDELTVCPSIVVLVGREADRWLARWSTADVVMPWPTDPIRLSAAITSALRERRRTSAAIGTRRPSPHRCGR